MVRKRRKERIEMQSYIKVDKENLYVIDYNRKRTNSHTYCKSKAFFFCWKSKQKDKCRKK